MKDYIVDHKLIDEWDWEKNSKLGLDPNKLTLGSNKKHGGYVERVVITGLQK